MDLSSGDGPHIHIRVYGLFSDVKITDQPA